MLRPPSQPTSQRAAHSSSPACTRTPSASCRRPVTCLPRRISPRPRPPARPEPSRPLRDWSSRLPARGWEAGTAGRRRRCRPDRASCRRTGSRFAAPAPPAPRDRHCHSCGRRTRSAAAAASRGGGTPRPTLRTGLAYPGEAPSRGCLSPAPAPGPGRRTPRDRAHRPGAVRRDLRPRSLRHAQDFPFISTITDA